MWTLQWCCEKVECTSLTLLHQGILSHKDVWDDIGNFHLFSQDRRDYLYFDECSSCIAPIIVIVLNKNWRVRFVPTPPAILIVEICGFSKTLSSHQFSTTQLTTTPPINFTKVSGRDKSPPAAGMVTLTLSTTWVRQASLCVNELAKKKTALEGVKVQTIQELAQCCVQLLPKTLGWYDWKGDADIYIHLSYIVFER